ncbi:hypothetical protein ABZY31_23280 [Streptomyces sp. NPDC006529]|uniref:hypothetical protein n=1 Tax=Streptomyces sp. NPDC006529 TaxID=3157177 RepID=UPI0033A4F0EA
MTTPTPEEQRPEQPQDPFADPYGTQTWQSETWDTSYMPVQPNAAAPRPPEQPEWAQPPAQQQQQQAYPQPAAEPVAPEGWFRDEAPQPQHQPPQQSYQPQQPPQPQRRGQHRAPDPAPAPSPDWSGGAAQGGVPWPDGSGAGAVAETAYLPPYREEPVASAAETAYLPPYREEPVASAAETAYLPPYREEDHPVQQPQRQSHRAPGPAQSADQAAHPAQQPPHQVRPQGQHRAPDPAPDWSQGAQGAQGHQEPGAGASWPGVAGPAAAEGAAERTAYLPPFPGDAVAGAAATGAQTPAPTGSAAYSPPTLGGSTRVVDPAQARAEGRSPIIDPGPQAAVLTAALGLLLAGAAAVGRFGLVVPLVALQALTAAGWFRLNGMWPARQGIALAFAGALAADAAVLALGRPDGPGAIIGTLGAWVLLTLVLQLRSHADPDERMYGLMASVASAALAIVCAGYLAADPAAVSVGAAAVAVAVFARALPLPATPSVVVSLVAAAGAGIAVGGLTAIGAGGALLGLAAGACALVGLRVAAYDYPSKFVHMTAGVALPLAAAAPAVYLIGRVVG